MSATYDLFEKSLILAHAPTSSSGKTASDMRSATARKGCVKALKPCTECNVCKVATAMSKNAYELKILLFAMRAILKFNK
ncbi:hypothetical protein [Campylobacter curvus]|uniref:hypothetical protein n=1 Tax=Campylobacter curvus TaxID=200 RepID=UPI00146FF9D5|nr:hypothetical protein [Campylobacter curvus]